MLWKRCCYLVEDVPNHQWWQGVTTWKEFKMTMLKSRLVSQKLKPYGKDMKKPCAYKLCGEIGHNHKENKDEYLWHPSFYLVFFKRFYLTWGRWFKILPQKNSPFQIFFLCQKFYLDSPKICLWSWRFLLLFGLKTKCFSLGKMPFENLFEICTMAFGKILCHFQQFPLAMALVQILSSNPSLTFGSWFTSNPASWTSP